MVEVGAARGRRCGRLYPMLGTRLSGRSAGSQIRLADSGWPVGGRGGPPRDGSSTQKNTHRKPYVPAAASRQPTAHNIRVNRAQRLIEAGP